MSETKRRIEHAPIIQRVDRATGALGRGGGGLWGALSRIPTLAIALVLASGLAGAAARRGTVDGPEGQTAAAMSPPIASVVPSASPRRTPADGAETQGTAPNSAPVSPAVPLGCVCDDGQVCTLDQCDSTGACVRTVLTCDDGDPCTSDACDEPTGCTHDYACDDWGACGYGYCDPYYGCVITPVQGSDGNVCTIDSCDPLVGVIHTPIDCDDHNICTIDDCHYQMGCTHATVNEGASCGDPCVPDGVCTQGTCVGTPVSCDDANPCTSDSCVSPNGQAECAHENDRNTVCDDGNVCTQNDICWGGVCAGGIPTYQQHMVAGAGDHPVAQAIADFNHDGVLDIVVVNYYSSSLTVLLNDGFGGFYEAPGSPVATSLYPESVAVSDFNGDNTVDLAVASPFNEVPILLGDGSGRFSPAPGSPLPIGGHPGLVASGDVNGDGKADLVVASSDPSYLTILLGDGMAGFFPSPGSPLIAGRGIPALLLADADADTKLDLIVANAVPPSWTGRVVVFRGDGHGRFTTTGSPEGAGRYPSSMASGDFDRDGTPDLAVSSESDDNLTVLLGEGGGLFTPAPGSPFDLRFPRAIAALDFDRDGRLDVVSADAYYYGALTMLRGDGQGRFAEAAGSLVPLGNQPTSLGVGDFNRDGWPDLAVTNYASNNVNILFDTPNLSAAGTVCTDSDPCTVNDACSDGVCHGGGERDCDDQNPCTDDRCMEADGCVHTNNTAPCSDGNACTSSDQCLDGVCEGGPAPSCDDGNSCTDDSCDAAAGCLHICNNTCNVKGEGYWRKLCRDRDRQDDHSDDTYTSGDVACVQESCTFSDIATIDAMCGVLDPGPGGSSRCAKAERKFLALLLNICRCRLQPSQILDTHCDGGAQTVAQAAAQADAALCDPNRTDETCRHPECSTEEITNGSALWQNTLRVGRDGAGVRLTWSAVYGDPAAEVSRKYRIWRRPLGSGGAFVMIGEVSDHTFTFLDAAPGGLGYEYEVTATY